MKEKSVEGLKTGTTTVGMVIKDAVVFGADSRATMGYFIANKTMDKIQPINDRLAITMAGSVGDAQRLVRWMQTEVNTYELETGEEMKVKQLATLLANLLSAYKYMPFWVQILLGGMDNKTTPGLYSIDMVGGVTEEKYIATGSGTTLALAVLENEYRENLKKEDAIEIASRAVLTATKRDVASGDSVRVAIIDKDGFRYVKKEEVVDLLKR